MVKYVSAVTGNRNNVFNIYQKNEIIILLYALLDIYDYHTIPSSETDFE